MERVAAVGRSILARPAADVLFDRGKAVDDVAERAMHRFQRVLGARDIVPEIVDVRRVLRAQSAGVRIRPHVFEVDQQIGQAALDSFQMAEPGIGGVQLLHQLDDMILEMAEGGRRCRGAF